MRNFRGNQSGSVAVATALTVTTLLVCVGIAVDFGRSFSSRSRLQTALDAAVTAGAGATAETQNDVALATLTDYLTQWKISPTKVEWSRDSSNAFTGAASASVPTTFLKILRSEAIDVSATSTALKTVAPSEVVFQLNRATGWYWKQITLWTHKPGDSTDTLVATFTYQPTNLASATGTTTGPIGEPVTLGTDYDYAYLRMDVSADGCGPGFAPKYPSAIDLQDTRYWANYECIPETASAPKTKPVLTYKTNDPETANHLFIDGQQLPSATAITNIFQCGRSMTASWEDSTNPDTNTPEWSAQDIFFDITATSCDPNQRVAGPARIIR